MRTRAPAAAAIALLTAATATCHVPATVVLVDLDTDVPRRRAMVLRATVWRGVAPPDTPRSHAWSTAVMGNTLRALPASFAVVPGTGAPRDGVASVLLEAQVAAGEGDEPALVIRRQVRFSFVPGVTLTVPVFLAAACGVRSHGCRTVPEEQCTVGRLCEEHDPALTCGAGGLCIPVEATPSLLAPRPVSPLASSLVATARPTFRWQLAAELDGALVELCRDPACGAPAVTFAARGASASPPTDLAPGVWFWRVRGRAGEQTGQAASTPWWFEVPPRAAPQGSPHGAALDLDGDARPEIAIGAPGIQRAYVVDAAAALASAGAATPVAVPFPDAAQFGTAATFGWVVAAGGDVDGDGRGELLVSAPNAGAGRVYVYAGSREGTAALPASTPGMLAGEALGTHDFGEALAGAGDVDGDGYADVLVGAPDDDRAFVLFGSARGVAIDSAVSFVRPPAPPEGGPIRFGGAVAGAGDVDGDGYADIAIGAPDANGTRGRVYLYRGGADRAAIASALVRVWDGAGAPGDDFGFVVALDNDVDGDGYADLLVSAPTSRNALGEVFVFRGGARGPSVAPDWDIPGPLGADTVFGRTLRSGDVDGDGYADLLVGARGADGGHGRLLVYRLAGAGASAATPAASVANPDAMVGSFGFAIGSARDIDGDRRADVVVGAWQYPAIDQLVGRVYLFRGAQLDAPSAVITGERANSEFGLSVTQ